MCHQWPVKKNSLDLRTKMKENSVGGSEQRCQHCIVDIADRGLIVHLQHRLNEFLREKILCSHLSLKETLGATTHRQNLSE